METLILILLFVTFALLLYSIREYVKTKRKYNAFMKEKDERETS
jgi:hypothetical protein